MNVVTGPVHPRTVTSLPRRSRMNFSALGQSRLSLRAYRMHSKDDEGLQLCLSTLECTLQDSQHVPD